MLILDNISSGWGQIKVLHAVSVAVNTGEIVTIVGANGAGKTTLLRTISGLLRPSKGQIIFNNKNITDLLPHERLALGIVQVPEGRQVFAPLTVYENLLLGTYWKHRQIGKKRLRELFDFVYEIYPILSERKNQLAGTLSGGEQQGLAIGRALMAQPKLLLIDEPSSGLAPAIAERTYEVLLKLNQQGIPILNVEQDVYRALSTAHRGYVLSLGSVILQGDAGELLRDEMVKRLYLGESGN